MKGNLNSLTELSLYRIRYTMYIISNVFVSVGNFKLSLIWRIKDMEIGFEIGFHRAFAH